MWTHWIKRCLTPALALGLAFAPIPDSEAQQNPGKAKGPPRVRGKGPIIGNGPIPKVVLARVIRSGARRIRACYERALLNNPGLAGRVIASFTIAPTGKVVASRLRSSTLGDPAVERCIVARVRGLIFPKPHGGGIVKVNYPFVFRPTGAARPPGKSCKTDGDCRLVVCCCSWRAFARHEPICKPAPCACPVPVAPKPIARCRAGRCVAVQDAKACYKRCLENSRARAMAWSAIQDACRRGCVSAQPVAPAPIPASRTCKADRDCVFAPRSGCGCPPCGPTRRRAVNRKHAAWLRREHARESCPKVKCARCRRPLQWLGTRAVCERGACTVR